MQTRGRFAVPGRWGSLLPWHWLLQELWQRVGCTEHTCIPLISFQAQFQLYTSAWNCLFCAHFNEIFFSILKARQQLGGTSCSDILPSTQHRAICSLCNLEPGASGCELTPARALEGIVPSDLPAVQMLLGTVTKVSPSS